MSMRVRAIDSDTRMYIYRLMSSSPSLQTLRDDLYQYMRSRRSYEWEWQHHVCDNDNDNDNEEEHEWESA